LGERRKHLVPDSYAPFGEGPRTCLGNHFAVAEGQALLATLAQRFDIELGTSARVEIGKLPGSLRPSHAIRLRLRSRTRAPRAQEGLAAASATR
jgi:cytochrome P450